MFGIVQITHQNLLKKAVFSDGTNLATRTGMKHSISLKQLTLFAGIVVALIVVFMLVSSSQLFESHDSSVQIPFFSISSAAKAALYRIIAFF